MTATMHDHQPNSNAVITAEPGSFDHPSIPALRGRSLRFVLLDHLMSVGQSSVAEMVELVAGKGYHLEGRASKIISDSLRWEILRNRVTRIARGVYRYRSAPRTTARRVRLFATRCHRWIDATLRGHQPPPTPPDPRGIGGVGHVRPGDAPWPYMGWLWVT